MTDPTLPVSPAGPTGRASPAAEAVPHIEFDLDDHRQQPGSVARNEASGSRTRRSTFASLYGSGAAELLDLPAANLAILQGTIARDFEHAIDDAASVHQPQPLGRRGLRGAAAPPPRARGFDAFADRIPVAAHVGACIRRESAPGPQQHHEHGGDR